MEEAFKAICYLRVDDLCDGYVGSSKWRSNSSNRKLKNCKWSVIRKEGPLKVQQLVSRTTMGSIQKCSGTLYRSNSVRNLNYGLWKGMTKML